MADITIQYNNLFSLGYISCNVPEDIMAISRQEIDNMLKANFKSVRPANKYLAGVIEHEYQMKKVVPILDEFFEKVIPEYWKIIGEPINAKLKYKIRKNTYNQDFDIWVNLQKKYEFNPPHDHSGELSFVYYINIPYDLEQERLQPHARGNAATVPEFVFLFSTPNSTIRTNSIAVDKNYQGTMIIFPSWLQHTVTPFYTSDEYRISVAGNLASIK